MRPLASYLLKQTITTLQDSAAAGTTASYNATNISINGNFLWFNYGTAVYKYDLTTFALLSTFTCNHGGITSWQDMVVDNNYIYLLYSGLGGSAIDRYNVADGSYVDTKAISATQGVSQIAQDDDYVYLATNYSLSLTYTKTIDKAGWGAPANLSMSQYYAFAMCQNGGYLYYVAGLNLYAPNGLTKVDISGDSVTWQDAYIIGTTLYPAYAKMSVVNEDGLMVSFNAAYDLGLCLLAFDLSTSNPTYELRASASGIYEVDVVFETVKKFWVVEHKEGEKIKIILYAIDDVIIDIDTTPLESIVDADTPGVDEVDVKVDCEDYPFEVIVSGEASNVPLPPDLFTGDIAVEIPDDYMIYGQAYLYSDVPMPITILAIVLEGNIRG